jgi:Tfp pilus assembly protein PilF
MSLLLDALKKAEAAKRQAAATSNGETSGSPSPAASELSLEPVAAAPTPLQSNSPLPELSAHLDTVDADLAAVQASPPMRKAQPASETKRPVPPPKENSAEREAVRNVFAAKRTPEPNRKLLWFSLVGVGLIATGIGAWLWWQLQSVGGNSLAAHPGLPATPPAQVAAPIVATPPLVTTAPIAAPSPPSSLPATVQSAEIPPASAAQEKVTRPPRQAAEPEGPVRISRGELRINPTLANAYERLQADDIGAAAGAYEKVLRTDPKNTDALLGMAVISQRMGHPDQAEAWYVQALEADPKDVTALSGLINLRGQSNPAAAESRLKGLLATQPESAALNFTLGNLYAGQKRWPDAQLAYFHAHTADPGNPDYLFNLAASLDHMHMPKLALEYYQAAVAASSGRRAGFDIKQVKARILELNH